MLKNTKKTCN